METYNFSLGSVAFLTTSLDQNSKRQKRKELIPLLLWAHMIDGTTAQFHLDNSGSPVILNLTRAHHSGSARS